ncbi:MAG: glycosyltransferase, partial [Anaerolineae bacterium]|nr:glycosyltransferase [Anaerolineae bacterium]
ARVYSALLNVCARFALRHADGLRSVSGMTRQQLEAYAPTAPMHQFMAWTDSAAFTEKSRAVPLSKSQNVVYAGVLIPRKGVHILIEAFVQIASRFPQTMLYLVGDAWINEAYTQQLKAQVEQFGLRSRVVFVGAVSQQALAAYLGRARVLVLPSFSEGLGRVLVEAMLCGTPAIGSAVDGIPDVVQDGINGYLVPPGDVDALTHRIAGVLDDLEIEAMGARAQAFAKTFFSPEAYVEGYRHLLDEVLSGTRHDRQPAAI